MALLVKKMKKNENFLWPDGNYYIVVADGLAWNRSSWREPSKAINESYSWQIVQWSGRAYT